MGKLNSYAHTRIIQLCPAPASIHLAYYSDGRGWQFDYALPIVCYALLECRRKGMTETETITAPMVLDPEQGCLVFPADLPHFVDIRRA